MHLPTELIDKILSHIPSDDKESLRSCSLVAKSWLDSCQRRLFETVHISPDTSQLWLDNISPMNTELLRHVRELKYAIRGKRGSWRPPCRIGDDLRDYLPSFYQLRRLAFCFVDIEPIIPDHTNLFFAFQHTLSSLSLVRVSITWNGFVTLLGYFPNLKSLEIHEVSFDVDTRPAPHLPRALRGRLFVRGVMERDPESFIDRFAGLKLEYEELVITGDYDQRLVAPVEGSLKRLRITRCNSKLTLDLSRCPELHRLEITLLQLREEEEILIASIASRNFRNITFTSWTSRLEWNFLLRNRHWISFDDMICGLVDRLRMSGHKHTLEVEFRAQFVNLDEEVDHGKFLPKFKKKGRVKIVEISSGKIREWP